MQQRGALIFIGLLFLNLIGCNKPAPAPLPTANFFVVNNDCVAPCSLFFYDASENAVQWEWHFGNGTSSSQEDDTILFPVSGTFETWLNVWNSDGVKDSIRKTIHLN